MLLSGIAESDYESDYDCYTKVINTIIQIPIVNVNAMKKPRHCRVGLHIEASFMTLLLTFPGMVMWWKF